MCFPSLKSVYLIRFCEEILIEERKVKRAWHFYIHLDFEGHWMIVNFRGLQSLQIEPII